MAIKANFHSDEKVAAGKKKKGEAVRMRGTIRGIKVSTRSIRDDKPGEDNSLIVIEVELDDTSMTKV